MDIKQFADRPLPTPWQGDAKIPWHDPEFSRRMLEQHLDASHDRASRRPKIVARQVDFLIARVLTAGSGRVLDVGCGPGLYCAAFATSGHDCVGLDFSPAAIAYAQAADTRSLYLQADVRTAEFGEGFDLVLMNYGEFNAFAPDDAAGLLTKMRDAAFPGGTIALEVQAEGAVRANAQTPQSWQALPRGLFSDEPHLLLTEHFWLADQRVSIARYYVVGENGSVAEYVNTLQGYGDHDYVAMLHAAGFRRIGRFSSLANDPGYYYLIASV